MKLSIQKNIIKSLAALAICLPIASYAANTLTLINHFDKSLSFMIKINPNVVPEFPTNFSLATNSQIQSTVVDINKEAYIRAEEVGNNAHNAFFGVEIKNNKTKIYGYIGKGIAYSWKTDTITFCTPEEYKKKHSC